MSWLAIEKIRTELIEDLFRKLPWEELVHAEAFIVLVKETIFMRRTR